VQDNVESCSTRDRHDRQFIRYVASGDAGKVLFGLVCVVAIAWIYLLAGAGVEMEQMGMGGGKMMLMSPAWRPSYAALVFAMWAKCRARHS